MATEFVNEMRDDLVSPKPKAQEMGMSMNEYAHALDNLVKVSVDTFVIDLDGSILLGKRNDYPVKGFWCFGGRMLPGELFRQSSARNLKRELSLDVNADKIEQVGCYSFVWDKRKEPPQNNGFHDIIVFMKYVIDSSQANIKQDATHNHTGWYSASEVSQMSKRLHPYLRRVLSDAGLATFS